jgi:hAT family C-terminal dimerisation region
VIKSPNKLKKLKTRPQHHDDDVLKFWSSLASSYELLAPLTQHLTAAPASQAYVERIFSVCGIFTVGRRNRLTKNLEMRLSLKLNHKLVAS